jgi:hypothetical protein|tara:strand:+ start:1237 stop:1440 length:204 start_codon:yes stop_codon:yes gene_type:complete
LKDLEKLIENYQWHEALDRTHVICSNINDHLIQHPVCKLDKEINSKVEAALTLLYEAYQIIGAKSIN